MWVIKWMLIVIVILFLIYFGNQNSSQDPVFIKFINWQSPPLQLWMVMYLSFAAGILLWLFGSIFKVMQLKADLRKSNKESNKLRKELDNLRNISIEDVESQVGEIDDEI